MLLRVEELLDDVKAYLKSSPKQLDSRRLEVEEIGQRIIAENESKYLGERVAQWSLTLKPQADHTARRIEIATPLQKAGAYLITAKIAGGNTSRVVMWIADTAIVYAQLAKRARISLPTP